MNEFVMAYVAVEIVKKNMKNAMLVDNKNHNKKNKKRKSFMDLF